MRLHVCAQEQAGPAFHAVVELATTGRRTADSTVGPLSLNPDRRGRELRAPRVGKTKSLSR